MSKTRSNERELKEIIVLILKHGWKIHRYYERERIRMMMLEDPNTGRRRPFALFRGELYSEES